jgi:hypothetical protein
MYELMIFEPVELCEDLVAALRIRIRIKSSQEGKNDAQK